MTIRKSRIKFAWGAPAEPRKHVGAIELAISSGKGGKGTIWIDDLHFEEREPASQTAAGRRCGRRRSLPGHAPERALDDEPTIGWKSAPGETSGCSSTSCASTSTAACAIDWDPEDYATAYRVEVSDDGADGPPPARRAPATAGATTSTCRTRSRATSGLVLEKSSRGQGYGISAVIVKPLEFSASPNQFFEAIAADSPPGTYPQVLHGQADVLDGRRRGRRRARTRLLNEEGMLEVDKGGFSIEPFLYVDGKLVTWSDGAARRSALDDGYLPIPSVTLGGRRRRAARHRVRRRRAGRVDALCALSGREPARRADAESGSSSRSGRSRWTRRGSRST